MADAGFRLEKFGLDRACDSAYGLNTETITVLIVLLRFRSGFDMDDAWADSGWPVCFLISVFLATVAQSTGRPPTVEPPHDAPSESTHHP